MLTDSVPSLGVLAIVRLEHDGHAVPRVVGEAAQIPHLVGW